MEKYYKIKRVSDNTLMHADDKKKNHKYIARVKMKNGKYRYFYNKAEYKDYLKGGEKPKKKKGFLSKFLESSVKSVKKFTKKIGKIGEKMIKKFKKKKLKDLVRCIEVGDALVSKTLNRTKIDKKNKSNNANKKESTPKQKRKHKYIERVKLPNGKYLYFYDMQDFINYKKRMKYQQNEPFFMKRVPEIKHNEYKTNDEHMAEINDKLDMEHPEKNNWARAMNCMYCTAAYELRQRGYDVEAADYVEERYGGRSWDLKKWYKDPQIMSIEPGKDDIRSMSMYTDSAAGQKVYLDMMKDRLLEAYFDDKKHYKGDNIRNSLEKNNPPNSRGNINVLWRSGGGHSMAYEVDKNGKARIRDCQTNKIVDINELADEVAYVEFARTDNLELKEGILNTIVKN